MDRILSSLQPRTMRQFYTKRPKGSNQPTCNRFSVAIDESSCQLCVASDPVRSVPEVTYPGTVHRELQAISGLDDVLVTYRTTGLHDCRHAGLRRCLHSIRKGEERVGCPHRALSSLACLR